MTETVPRIEPRKMSTMTAVSTKPMAISSNDVGDGGLHVLRLIEDYSRDQALRNIEQVAHTVTDAIDDRNGVAVATLFQDRQVHRLLAIDTNQVVLNRGGIFGMPDVGEAQNAIPDGLQRNVIHVFRRGKLAIAIYVVVARTDAHVARWKNSVGFVHGAHHVHRAQLRGFQLYRIDVELDLAVLAAVGLRNRSPRDVRQLIAHIELPKIVQLRFVESLALQRDQTNGKTGGIELQHHGRQRPLGQAPQVRHGKVGDLADGSVRVGTGLKVNLDETHAREGARFNVIDVAA